MQCRVHTTSVINYIIVTFFSSTKVFASVCHTFILKMGIDPGLFDMSPVDFFIRNFWFGSVTGPSVTTLDTVKAKPTQPSIPPESVDEYQLRLGRQMQVHVWFIRLADVRGMCRQNCEIP